MPDWRVLAAIAALGAVSYGLRAGGYLGAGLVREDGWAGRLLRLAPGNLFAAFVAAGCLQGGLPSCCGAAVSLAAMIVFKREWAALAAGFIGAVAASAALG